MFGNGNLTGLYARRKKSGDRIEFKIHYEFIPCNTQESDLQKISQIGTR